MRDQSEIGEVLKVRKKKDFAIIQSNTKISGRLSGGLCWPHGQNAPAQRDSGMSNLKTSPYRPLAVRLVPLCGDPYRPLDFKTSPAQRHSKMSNGRLSGVSCWPHGQNRPA